MLSSMKSKILSTAAAAVVAAAGLTVSGAIPAVAHSGSHAPKPTVVLVHGAFADSSGFGGIVQRLLADGYPVVAPANPLRGVASDAASIRALLDTISGPIILVGHSYGGNVISEAAAGDAQVKALVYIAAYIPDTGETAAYLTSLYPGSVVGTSLKPVAIPGGGTDLYIDPAVFPSAFAGGVPLKEAQVFAYSQRAVTAAALNEPAAADPAWKTIPSYDLISGADIIIPTAAQEFMAKRAHATTEVVKGASHMGVFYLHPGTTTAFIEKAAKQTVK